MQEPLRAVLRFSLICGLCLSFPLTWTRPPSTTGTRPGWPEPAPAWVAVAEASQPGPAARTRGDSGSAEAAEPALTAKIRVDAGASAGPVSPLLFGTNISHPGHVNGIPDWIKTEEQYRQAMRKWYGYLPMVSELGPTILRFPGGLNANEYLWTRGIGPVLERRPMTDRKESPHPLVGTDEFLLLCEELGAEAMITVNINRASGGSLLEVAASPEAVFRKNAAIAADWVEYCNAPHDGSNPRGGTDWAAVRARNGHAAPYGVRYWELGNELQDMPANRYGMTVPIFSREMKAVDPTIQVGVIDPLPGWPQDKVRTWFREVGSRNRDAFDFWIHHSYSPGATGKLKGFALNGRGAAITVPLELPAADRCTLHFRAGTNKGNARVRVSLSAGQPAADAAGSGSPGISQRVWEFGKGEKELEFESTLPAGPHSLRLELLEGGPAVFYHMAEWSGSRGSKGYLDLKNSPELFAVIVSGALAGAEKWWSGADLLGKPFIITEYNSISGPVRGEVHRGFAYSLRDALNLGMYVQSFLRRGVPVATQWLLYGDMQGYGLIEGVAVDPAHGRELGRADPRPRPSYHMLKLYRDHLSGEQIPVRVESPRYRIGQPGSHVSMGFVTSVSLDLPYLQAVASRSADGSRVSLVVQNQHPASALSATLSLAGFPPGPRTETFVVDGATPWTSNEPESCPGGDCVSLRQDTLDVPGPQFVYTFPPHSATAMVFLRAGVKREAMAAPRALSARAGQAGIELAWASPEGNAPAAYHLYRSRFSWGPFRNRVARLPAGVTRATDSPADPCIAYTYAVRAVNSLGEEGPFSNQATLEWKPAGRECAVGQAN